MSDILYLGIKGQVVAIDKDNGKEKWSTELKGSGFVTLLIEEEQIFAHTYGNLFCLDKESGRVIWQNGLRGLGYGFATLATEASGQDSAAMIQQIQAQQAAAASAAAAGAAAASSNS